MNKRPCNILRYRHGIYYEGFTSYLPWWAQAISFVVTLMLLIEAFDQTQHLNMPLTVSQESIAREALDSYHYTITHPQEDMFPIIIHVHLVNESEVIGDVYSKVRANYNMERIPLGYKFDDHFDRGVFQMKFEMPNDQQNILYNQLLDPHSHYEHIKI